jgi:hypothetical protein
MPTEDIIHTDNENAFGELEPLVEGFREQGDTIRGYVDVVARQHEHVREIAGQARSRLKINLDEPSAAADDERIAERLREMNEAAYSQLEERLKHVESFMQSLPDVRAELENLALAAKNTALRSERVSQKVLFTHQRLESGIETLNGFPERVNREAEVALQRLAAASKDFETTLEERLSGLNTGSFKDVGKEAEQVLALTQERLDVLSHKIVEAEKRLRKTWRREQAAFSRTLAETISVHRESVSAIEKALQERLEAHEQALLRMEHTVRRQFQHQLHEIAQAQDLPQFAQWDQQIDEARDAIGLHVEQFSRDAEDKIMLLRSRMDQFEQHSSLIRSQVAGLKKEAAIGFAALAVLAVASATLLHIRSENVAGEPLAQTGISAMESVNGFEPAPKAIPAEVFDHNEPAAVEAMPAPLEYRPVADLQPVEPAPAVVPAASSGYVWIVGSDSDPEAARTAADRLLSAGAESGVYPAESRGSVRYRVGVGFYADPEAAEAAKPGLAGHLPPDAWLLRVVRN